MAFSKTTLVAALTILAVTLVTAACGGQHKASIAHGREVFQNGAHRNQACSFCHTLRAAVAGGGFAPNLDGYITEQRTNGLGEAKITKVVLTRIHTGPCLDPSDPSRCMPPDLVTGGDAQDVAAFVARCAARAGLAECSPPKPASALAAKGQRLFGSLRCLGCHSINGNVAVAPTVKGLFGSQVELTDGTRVTADSDYLSVAISTPDVQVAKGYKAGFMSSVIRPGALSAAQIEALVAYIKTLK